MDVKGETLEIQSTRFDKIKCILAENRLLRNLMILLGCFLGGFIILSPFLCSPVMNLGDDLQYHFTVMKAFDEAFQNGQFFNKILPLLCNDYGYGTGNFYGTLPAMLTVVVKNVLNCSLWSAIKLSVYVIYSFSILLMYCFSMRIFKKFSSGLISTVIFATFTYYLSDLYVRFAYSEFFLFIGMVAVFWGIYELIYRNNKGGFFVLFTVGLSWCILTHLSLTVWICLICLVFMLVQIKQLLKDFNWIVFLLSCVVILCATAYFTVPLLEYYLGDTLYNVFDSSLMNTTASFLYNNTSWAPIIYLPDSNFWSLLRVCFPIYYLFIVWGAILTLKKRYRKNTNFLENQKPQIKSEKAGIITMLAIIFVVIFGMTKYSLWYLTPSILRMIQYPFRLLMLSAPFFALIAPIALAAVKRNRKKIAIISVSVVCTFAIIFGIVMDFGNVFTINDETSSNITTSFGCGWQYEYLPAVCETDYIVNRNNELLYNPNELDVKDLVDYRSEQQLQMYFLNGYDLNEYVYSETPYTDTNIVMKIPYSENLKVTQYSASFTNPNRLEYSYSNYGGDWYAELEFTPIEIEGETYIQFTLKREISLIVVDYSNAPQTSVWLDENPYQFKTLSGDASCSNFEKDGINYTVDIEMASTSTIELPTVYYSGYTLELITADGSTEIDGVMNENGMMEVTLNEGGTLSVCWEGSLFVQIGKILAIIGALLFLAIWAISWLVPKSFWDKFRRNIHDFCEAHCTIMEVMRFLVIGAIATIIDWVFMAIVMYAMEPTIYESFVQVIIGGASNPSTLSTVIGTGVGALIGMVVSYIFSVIFVFKEKGNSKSVMGFAMFIFLSLIGLGLHMWGMFIGYNLLHYNEWFVKIVMSVVVLIYNYISKRIIIFNNKRKSVVAKSIIKD
ncbi:MAG: GtrA family protein [Clostridia bacterium]|nr:GtrA family protein [Clostridia bacterium]